MSSEYDWVEVAPGRQVLVRKDGQPLEKVRQASVTEDRDSVANVQRRRYKLDKDEQAIPLALPGHPTLRMRKSVSDLQRRELIAAEYRKHGREVQASDIEVMT